MSRLTRADMESFAQEWIAAWNRRDVAAVVAPFAKDAVFLSPRISQVLGRKSVSGKEMLRVYWERALESVPDLRFEFDCAICDEETQSMVVHYTSVRNGQRVRACELMKFDEEGRQIYGEALYGAVV